MTDLPTDGCEEPTDVDYEGGLKKRQIVLEFDMATWKVLIYIHYFLYITETLARQRAIEVFNITETMIPQRPPAETRLGDKWYG